MSPREDPDHDVRGHAARLASTSWCAELAPGHTMQVVYVGSTFWHMGAKAELRLA